MKNKRKRRPSIHPKYIYIFLSIVCALLVVLSFKFSNQFTDFKTTVGDFISPMQGGINKVGKFISDKTDLLTSKEKLLEENKQLKQKIDALNYDNKILASENSNLDNYRELYKLDQQYPDYPKVVATVIGRDGNNWFNLFTIDKGRDDGVDVDMNVIAGNGLVGIVSEAGRHYAKVRSIIDDKSNVSATPLVGEFTIKNFDSLTIHLAITTFWRFPPLISDTGSSTDGVLIRNCFTDSSAIFRSPA